MATILLSAAGAAVGSSIGGSVLGLPAAVIGRAVGATVGRVIDERVLGSGSGTVETGRVDRFRLTGASEGAPVQQVHGRMRVGGHVIWATQFLETVTTSGGGGKGGPSQPTTRTYSYSVSLAVALCAGPITRVGRVWADGVELSVRDLNMRVYDGSEAQVPDPKIEAVEGVGNAPAYRGTAYVVFEDLQLAQFGNRVPQFSFEVVRTGDGDLASVIQGVALIPGTGEYSLATSPVYLESEPGVTRAPNVHTVEGVADIEVSLDSMVEELPNCGATSLIVSCFGSDLRCGSCSVAPRVEQLSVDSDEMLWTVSGLSRGAAGLVPMDGDDRPLYGGTPCDASVLEALTERGQAVTFYPFILMEQIAGNALPDPYGGQEQSVLPWRGRITSSIAPLLANSPDGTSLAEAEVAAFFGSASPADFTVSDTQVTYVGTDGFSYRRFILHYAHLCALAGGVDAFCIGSEMRGLTQIRGVANSFPAVTALKQLAADVRSILGPSTKIGYAADWSEYFGYHPQDGSGDVYFHLDPLWADPNIDFIGIDNYMPLSDWRDGLDHADAAWKHPYDLDYLANNVAGGEGYDWYYASSSDSDAQVRTEISDGTHGEPWVFRYKDILNWWRHPHHERVSGVRTSTATEWVPESKPIWFTEYGCAAVDKGTNQPNKFVDPKSSESALPKYSSGARDDLIQIQYYLAMNTYWSDASHNPVSSVYGGAMVDMSRAFAWAWDARPYPTFPNDLVTWSDGENYVKGHWLNGRSGTRSLKGVVEEVCAQSGLEAIETSGVFGAVRGYLLQGSETGREAVQPLSLAYGMECVDAGAELKFSMRDGVARQTLGQHQLAFADDDQTLVSMERTPDAETSGRVRLSYIGADGDFDIEATEGIFPDEATHAVATTELALSLTKEEAANRVERWLSEARVARDRVTFSAGSACDVGPGDTVTLDVDGVTGSFRVDRIQDLGLKQIEAVRVEPSLYRSAPRDTDLQSNSGVVSSAGAVPVWPVIMDLPLLRGDESELAPWVAATADPWPGIADVYSATDGANWTHEVELGRPAKIGRTLSVLAPARAGVWDRGAALTVKIVGGALSSVTNESLFAGANAVAIGDPDTDVWEVLQFRNVELVAPDTWDLTLRLRGQRGTDSLEAGAWPVGSTVVFLEPGALVQLDERPALRGLARTFRIGPAAQAVDHAAFRTLEHTTVGNGLRPYAPVHVSGATGETGDVTVTWVRQTRIDGDSWDGEVPLGETVESYTVRVESGEQVVRESVVTSPSWIYTASARSADGVVGPFDILVAQNSDRFGPGLFRRISIDE